MTEKTEAEKAQEAFERKFAEKAKEDFERKFDEQRVHSDHQFQVAMKIQDVRYSDMRTSFEERKKELLAQNDGLLGAVGRLHGENDVLKRQVLALESTLQRFEHETAVLQEKMECISFESKDKISELTAALGKANHKKAKK